MLVQRSPCAQPQGPSGLRLDQPDGADEGARASKGGLYIGSEDCLYLNVWAPLPLAQAGADPARNLPVMLWIHGGGNVFSDCSIYDGGILATCGVVVVTLNYRLGTLGWFSHSALRESAEDDADRAANFGLLDIIQALKWVKENIHNFGGDPNNVTIFGESGGGTNVLALVASPRAEGLFHRAIAQSATVSAITQVCAEGFFDQVGTIQSSREVLVQLLINDGLADGRNGAKRLLEIMKPGETAAYLRSKSPGEIHQTYAQLLDYHRDSPFFFENISARTHQTLILDDVVLPKHGLLKQFSITPCVPIMLGTTRDEDHLMLVEDPRFVSRSEDGSLQFMDVERFRLASELMTALWKANGVDEPADALSRQQAAVYVFRFDWDEAPPFPGDDHEPYGAAHGAEIKFFFGSHIDNPLYNPAGYKSHPTFKAFGETLRSYWVEFAKTGTPGSGTGGDLPRWEPWHGDQVAGRFMILDSVVDGGCRMATDFMTKASVLRHFREDPRMGAQEKRNFLEMLLNYPYHWGRITIKDLHAFEQAVDGATIE